MLAFLALCAPASAQTAAGAVPAINVQNFRPSIDASRTLWVDDSSLPERAWMARALFHYARDPLAYELDDGTRQAIVSNVLQADVAAGVRISRFRLGLDLPLYITQDGAAGAGAGLGDIAVDGKVAILDRAEMPLGLALDARVSFPTATVDNALGSPNTGWEVDAVVDRELGDLLVALNVGVRGGPRADLENIDLDDFLVARLAGSYAVSDKAGVAIELAGEKSLSASLDNRAGFPIEWLASGYGYATDALVIRGGVGTGLTSGIGAPDFRVALGVGWEPRAKPEPVPEPLDTDSDGLTDAFDPCPAEPEDIDAFEDADGCPEYDNDADGLVDAVDECPVAAEDVDDVRDMDGCPEPEVRVAVRLLSAADGTPITFGHTTIAGPGGEKATGGPERVLELVPGRYEVSGSAASYEDDSVPFDVMGPTEVAVVLQPEVNARIVVRSDHIDLREKVFFHTNKATIQPRSFGLLDLVADVMRTYPDIQLLRVEGHTDSRGNDAYNLDLSRRRAESVRAYIVSKGIAPERLASDGFGETRPLDPALTESAYEKNRRVEIRIEKRASAVAATPTAPATTPSAPVGGTPDAPTAGAAAPVAPAAEAPTTGAAAAPNAAEAPTTGAAAPMAPAADAPAPKAQ